MSLKIGNLDIQAIKVGSADCKVYIGDELLYPSEPQSLTWVQFNSGDTINNGLNYYGIRGVANVISNTFSAGIYEDIVFDYSRNRVDVYISTCYSETITPPETNVEYVFSNIGCADYYTINSIQTASSTFELLIMQ